MSQTLSYTPLWHIGPLCATILASIAAEPASQWAQSHIDTLCEYRVGQRSSSANQPHLPEPKPKDSLCIVAAGQLDGAVVVPHDLAGNAQVDAETFFKPAFPIGYYSEFRFSRLRRSLLRTSQIKLTTNWTINETTNPKNTEQKNNCRSLFLFTPRSSMIT